jgi:LysM repeat protein
MQRQLPPPVRLLPRPVRYRRLQVRAGAVPQRHGQVFPFTFSQRHTAVRGDTVDSIARAYGIPKQALVAANQNLSQGKLLPGTVVVLPRRRGGAPKDQRRVSSDVMLDPLQALLAHAQQRSRATTTSVLPLPPSLSFVAHTVPSTGLTIVVVLLAVAATTIERWRHWRQVATQPEAKGNQVDAARKRRMSAPGLLARGARRPMAELRRRRNRLAATLPRKMQSPLPLSGNATATDLPAIAADADADADASLTLDEFIRRASVDGLSAADMQTLQELMELLNSDSAEEEEEELLEPFVLNTTGWKPRVIDITELKEREERTRRLVSNLAAVVIVALNVAFVGALVLIK